MNFRQNYLCHKLDQKLKETSYDKYFNLYVAFFSQEIQQENRFCNDFEMIKYLLKINSNLKKKRFFSVLGFRWSKALFTHP